MVDFSFWLGGCLLHSHVGPHTVHISPEVALGVNSHASHDLRLNDANQAAVFLNLYLNDAWLDAQCKDLAQAMVLPHPCIGITSDVNAVCVKFLTHLVSPLRERVLSPKTDVAALLSTTLGSSITVEQLQAMPVRRRMIDCRLRVVIAYMQDNLGSP